MQITNDVIIIITIIIIYLPENRYKYAVEDHL